MNSNTEKEANNPTFSKPVLAEAPFAAFLDYEIRSSWWASFIGWDWGQELSGKYFAWKTRRKFERYKTSKMWEKQVKNYR